MSHKEVFLFDENSAIKKIDSEPNLTDNEKNIHSDLKENKKDIFVDINDPFFFS